MVFPALPAGLRTRIAPTPSGLLHPGNGASFVLAWKLARAAGGTVLLRIDDLDEERVRPAYVEDVFRTLDWLGITWDEGPQGPSDLDREWSQRYRMERYQALLEGLLPLGVVYACTCSRSLLATCTCRSKALALDGPEVTWRLSLQDAGPVRMTCWPPGDRMLRPSALMADPVLRQRSGRPAYQVASLVDDLLYGIDFIVRGEDLLPSTGCQLHVAELVGEKAFSRVRVVHHRLETDDLGQKLSKSQGAGSLQAMRQAGASPKVVHQLADAMLEDLLRQAEDQA
jgi:glutamyl-tRNA synthetase